MSNLYSRYLSFAFLFVLLFIGCKEETIILDSPEISIESIEISSLTKYIIHVKINPGEGQEIKKAQLVLKDITTVSDDIVANIEVSSGRTEEYQININTEKPAHDYIVKAILYTDLYTYISDEKILRSVKNNYNLRVINYTLYSNPDEGIALYLNPGQNFPMNVDFLNKYVPQSIELKLGAVSLQNNLDFSGNLYDHDGIYTASGTATIPEDVSPGVYGLTIYVDGLPYNSEDKIKVLEGKWEIFADNYEGERRGNYAWFVINNKLYLVGGSYYVRALDYSPVWCYDLETKDWVQRKNFPHKWNLNESDYGIRTEILPFSIQHRDNGYVLVRYDQKIGLWKYDEQQDQWIEISEYPGKGDRILTCFILTDKLYLGGGLNTEFLTEGAKLMRDFWSYNFESDIWEMKNDLPFDPIAGGKSVACSSGTNGFVLQPTKVFWKYDAMSDWWNELKIFPGPWRFTSQFTAVGDNLYLVGGESQALGVTSYYIRAYNDCWKYSIVDQSWSLVAFVPQYVSNGISFSYNNKIITGLGYLIDNSYSSSNSDHVLFEFTPDN
jgi:N-acetylneuraminic acid mutarotase